KAADFADEVGTAKFSAQELKLAGSLVDASTSEKMDLSEYKDLFTERVKEVLEAKLAGKELKAPRAVKAPHVINLMDALRQTLKKTETGKGKSAGQHPRHRARLSGKRKAG